MRSLIHIGLKILVTASSVSLIGNVVIIFIGKPVGLRREDRINSVSALFQINVLGYQLSHRESHIFEVPQESIVKGLLGL